MSEFKFACPVCGQHMAAASSASGTHIECPTCFQEIIVPNPPATGSKYTLSATQPIKPQPPAPSAPSLPPLKRPVPSLVPRVIVGVVAAALLAGTILFAIHWRDAKRAAEAASKPIPPRAHASPWNLDLGDSSFPDRVAFGKIHGNEFVCDRATLQGGVLTLRQGRSGAADLSITIFLFARQAEDLNGQALNVSTNDTGAPRIMLRWSQNDQPLTQTFLHGYALKLDFGEPGAAGIPGKILLSLPDQAKSWIAGTFNAEIRSVPGRPRP